MGAAARSLVIVHSPHTTPRETIVHKHSYVTIRTIPLNSNFPPIIAEVRTIVHNETTT